MRSRSRQAHQLGMIRGYLARIGPDHWLLAGVWAAWLARAPVFGTAVHRVPPGRQGLQRVG